MKEEDTRKKENQDMLKTFETIQSRQIRNMKLITTEKRRILGSHSSNQPNTISLLCSSDQKQNGAAVVLMDTLPI